MTIFRRVLVGLVWAGLAQATSAGDPRQLLFGDTHLHTSYSFDAYLNKNQTADPDTAYRWAKGMPVIHPYNRARVQIGTPLDFLVVSDHAELMGVIRAINMDTAEQEDLGLWGNIKRWFAVTMLNRAIESGSGGDFFNSLLPTQAAKPGGDPVADAANIIPESTFGDTLATETTAWHDIVDAAERHNSNISKGYMYAQTTLKGAPITAEYARRRMYWEPVSEVTQIKGDSETHPSLSPDDDFADFETYTHYIQQDLQDYKPEAGDYARQALVLGLALEQETGVNPYQFGMIGSTDSHSGLSSAEEDNFWGKFSRDSTPETKRSNDSIGGGGVNGWNMSASGLAAVWAAENSRDEIFAAFQRKEVYATTGTRLQVRVFGGWDFDESALQATDFAAIGYRQGVPMGGALIAATRTGYEQAPQMLIRALKDPEAANLDRIQVVKGWVDLAGTQHERVYDAAWSGDRQLDAEGKLEVVGNTVNLETTRYDNSIGSEQLSALWTDPDFDPQQRAFYYIRVLQIPTPRHSLLDALALQSPPPEEGPATIQERAYTSPIWYTPGE